MENAKILFDKINLDYINEEMIGKEYENHWLECKTKDSPVHGGLSQGDKGHYAKALSGFSNTSGGVLIFGLKASKDKNDDMDLIREINPINEIDKFENQLREKESRIVERPVKNVLYEKIKIEDNKGLIKIYIPESDTPPHRSLVDKQFYMRGGGTFVPLDLRIIEELFYKTKSPQLKCEIRKIEHPKLRVFLVNNGKAIARFPFFAIEFPEKIQISGYEIDGWTRNHSVLRENEYRGAEGRFAIYSGNSDKVVHPGTEIPIIDFHLPLKTEEFSGKRFVFKYCLFAENMSEVTGECIINT